MKRKWHCLQLVAALMICSTPVFAGTTISAELGTVLKSAVPTLKFKDGVVAEKIAGNIQTTFQYSNGVLTTSSRSDGTIGEYLYGRDGKLDRIIFSNGIVHTAQFDDLGNFYGFISSSGKALQISGNARVGRQLRSMQASDLKVPTRKVGSGPQPDSLAATLVAVDGWEVSPSKGGVDTPNDCDGEIDDQQRIGGKGPSEKQSTQASAQSVGPSEEPPKTNCAVVVIVGGNEGGDQGGGGNGGGGSGIITVGNDLPPGVGPNDRPDQIACFAAAYRSWTIMDGVCSREPNMRDKLYCNDVNMRLYTEELAYCRTL